MQGWVESRYGMCTVLLRLDFIGQAAAIQMHADDLESIYAPDGIFEGDVGSQELGMDRFLQCLVYQGPSPESRWGNLNRETAPICLSVSAVTFCWNMSILSHDYLQSLFARARYLVVYVWWKIL